jgi:ADP-ribose pyrophosphatase
MFVGDGERVGFGRRLPPAEEGDDVARPAPAAASGEHQVLLRFEEDPGCTLDRTVDAQLFRVLAIELTEQVNDPSPDVGRNEFDVLQPAFFDRAQELIGLAQLVAWRGGGATLPGPEAMLCDFQNGALNHDLSSHDNPGMEEMVETQEVYGGKLFRVYRDQVRLPDGHLTTREIVRHPGSVGIIPRQQDGRIVLVRQYRYVTGRELWEIPAGTLDKPGEDIPSAARRELAEEAGLKAQRWTTLGSAYLMPGYCDERMTFFLADELSSTPAHAELDESFKVNAFDAHDLQVLRSSGELQDAKTLLGLAWAGVPLWTEPRPR